MLNLHSISHCDEMVHASQALIFSLTFCLTYDLLSNHHWISFSCKLQVAHINRYKREKAHLFIAQGINWTLLVDEMYFSKYPNGFKNEKVICRLAGTKCYIESFRKSLRSEAYTFKFFSELNYHTEL